jgi:TolB-like protein/tetratricopeptide (TPR) repeat protein
MDFGAGSELHTSSTADIAGTPLYAAPEVLAGQGATVRSDVYSLGVLLHHLLTGSYPVRGRSLRDVRDAHERGERVRVQGVRPEVRPRLARAIERACDPRPERRHPDADALGRDLLALQRRPAAMVLRFGATAAAVVAAAFLVSEAWARLSTEHRSLRSRVVGLIAGAPSGLERPVIAVLPFESHHSEANGNQLVDSVTTGLIRQLSVINGLQVRSEKSSFMFRERPRNLNDVGSRLSVNMIVDGDAHISGDRLLINASLLSVPEGTAVWSHSVDRTLKSEGDVAALIDELTRNIVNGLRLRLVTRTQRRYQTDIATFQKYGKAQSMREARGIPARAAISEFEDVVRADPSYAPAKASLAYAYGALTLRYPNILGFAIAPVDAVRLMEPLTRSALEIDPLLAEAHAAQGFLHAMALRWTEAEASFLRAIGFEPNRTSIYADFALSTLLPWGRVDEAVRLLETAVEMDPLSLDARRILAEAQLHAGRYEEARDTCRRALELDPKLTLASHLLEWALYFGDPHGERGDRAEALHRLETFDGDMRHALGVRGYLHAIYGRRAEAEAIAAQFDHLPLRQAEIYGLMGDKDRAFEALERLAKINPVRAARHLNQPEIGVRDDPRVVEFRRKLKIPQ